jgi:hypothetical protein
MIFENQWLNNSCNRKKYILGKKLQQKGSCSKQVANRKVTLQRWKQ